MKFQAILAGLFLAASFAAPSAANIPNPALCTIPNVLTSADGSATYQVTIVGQLGPVNQALVELSFTPEADALLCWCVGQTRPLIAATTNAQGEATFTIGAGGCINPSDLAGGVAVEVYANGFKMAEVGVVSVDAVDASGLLPHLGWDPGNVCSTGLSDATFHSGPIATGAYSFCSDLDSDGEVGLQDGVLATGPIVNGSTCTRQ